MGRASNAKWTRRARRVARYRDITKRVYAELFRCHRKFHRACSLVRAWADRPMDWSKSNQRRASAARGE